jgi:acetamidase/formamidase
LLFTPAAPLRTVQYVPGHNRWHPDIPPVAEVIAGGSARLHCQGGEVLCGPVGVVGAEPGDLVMVEVLGIGRSDGHRGTQDGWIDLRVHLTKRGIERFRVTEPVVMPMTTSSLDATVAGVTPYVA